MGQDRKALAGSFNSNGRVKTMVDAIAQAEQAGRCGSSQIAVTSSEGARTFSESAKARTMPSARRTQTARGVASSVAWSPAPAAAPAAATTRPAVAAAASARPIAPQRPSPRRASPRRSLSAVARLERSASARLERSASARLERGASSRITLPPGRSSAHPLGQHKHWQGVIPMIDGRAAAAAERQRTARRLIEDCMAGSNVARHRKPKPAPMGGMTHRDVMTERQLHARECSGWAAKLHEAIQDGIDNGLPDQLLEGGVARILELEEVAQQQQHAAQKVVEAREALRATPIKTPVTRQRSNAARRAAAAQRQPLSEGSLVQLKGLENACGLSNGVFDVPLNEYNGRKGRVSKDPPPWVIKAVGLEAGCELSGSGDEAGTADGGAAPAPNATLSPRLQHGQATPEGLGLELVPVLLDSRSTDADRFRGVWVAVPHANIRVLQR